MSFPNYFAGLKAANPKLFEAEKIAMRPEVFRDQLERAYLAGAKAGIRQEQERILEESQGSINMFDQIFGKGKRR